MGSATAKARFIILALSCVTTLIATAFIIAALFSVSFRTVEVPYLNGKKYFGLFRYCWEPYLAALGNLQISSSNGGTTCYMRSAGHEQSRMGFLPGPSNNEFMFEFEKTTLVLLVTAIMLCIMAICFALCTLFSELCALAHSTLILAAAIANAAGFGVYTYNNEQPDLLGENDKGNMLPYHYGWGYYYSGISALLLLLAFMISIFAASVFFYHKRRLSYNRSHIKRTTVKL